MDERSMAEMAADSKATGMAVLIILIGWAIAGFVGAVVAINPFTFLASLVFGALFGVVGLYGVVGLFIWTGILHILARIFGGVGDYIGLFRTLGVGSVLQWLMFLALVPFFGAIIQTAIAIWSLVIAVVAVKVVHKLPTGKSAAVVIIPTVILLILVLAMMMAIFALVGLSIFAALQGQTVPMPGLA
ncbi:hypothetical protein GF351_03170 [Candidatus Woesearchaeota archaeon]|nr:hypothetical protein [Candidatus Woesearchaeota archaeon]